MKGNEPSDMTFQLSKRLAAIAGRIPRCGTLADIGSDHALLPIHAVRTGLCRKAVAGDLHDGPIRAARNNIAAAGLSDRIDVRKGDGLAVLMPGEADVIVIAGMGGSTMTGILDAGESRLEGVRTLILQPNVGTRDVRRWLHDHGWYLRDECVLEEDGVYYDILEAVPARPEAERFGRLYEPLAVAGGPVVTADLLLLLGPHLLRRPTPAFFGRWREELAKRERIIENMKKSVSGEAAARRQRLEEETAAIREVLSCLQTGIPSSG